MRLSTDLSNHIVHMTAQFSDNIRNINKQQDQLVRASARFRLCIDAFTTALADVGLEVATCTFRMGALTGETLFVNVHAKPTSGKFRFLTFTGYTARGDGKNSRRLRTKALQLESAIKAKTGLKEVQVNPYSLELRKGEETKKVLIEVSV